MIMRKHCDYCLHSDDDLIKVKFDDHNINYYCKNCVRGVIKDMQKTPWIKKKKLYMVNERYLEFR